MHTYIHTVSAQQESARSTVISKAMRRWELFLCWLLLSLKGWVFWKEYGLTAGFDAGAHLEMLHLINWTDTDVALRASFYSYHPPLAFLFARSIHLLGFTDVMSVQILALIASVGTFFFLRKTLKYLGLLYTPAALIFLYTACSLPMQIFLLHSVNLDGLMLCLSSIVLFYSIRVFWSEDRKADTWVDCLAILAALSLGLMVKFSGILLLSIPFTVALLRTSDRKWFPHLIGSGGLALIAVAIVFPYYLTRYYIPEGTFFPNNQDWLMTTSQQEARRKRDEDPKKFILDLVRPAAVHASEGITKRDYVTPRLSDTWRDFWMKEEFLGPMNATTKKIGSLELKAAAILVMAGLLMYLRRAHRGNMWERFGGVLLIFSFVYFAGFLHYIYSHPFAGWGTTKGIYIAPVSLGIAYLIAQATTRTQLRPAFANRTALTDHCTLGLTAIFMMVNYGLRMY